VEDPGAHDLGKAIPKLTYFVILIYSTDSSDSDDHFSDAQSGPDQSGAISPVIPLTRVEKVDDEPSHGEVPGTEAYEVREADAVPDEVEIIPEPKGQIAKSSIPAGVAERIVRTRADSTPGDLPIPITKVEKVDSEPSHGEVPGTKAYELRKEDAEPDIVEEIGDAPGKNVYCSSIPERLTEPGSPTGARSPTLSHVRRKSSAAGKSSGLGDYNEEEDGDFGDDFDDFEEGEDTEFGDFDDGFQDAKPVSASQPTHAIPSFVSSNKHLRFSAISDQNSACP